MSRATTSQGERGQRTLLIELDEKDAKLVLDAVVKQDNTCNPDDPDDFAYSGIRQIIERAAPWALLG
jgi:hypothetical protein